MTADAPDPYRILGVRRGASLLEIARARRRLAKRYHPDVAIGTMAADQMRRVNEAWDLLSDPVARSRWDVAHPATTDPGTWVAWSGPPPPRAPHPDVAGRAEPGGNGWWWTLIASVALLIALLAAGLIGAMDGPDYPGIRDSPVLQDNLDGP